MKNVKFNFLFIFLLIFIFFLHKSYCNCPPIVWANTYTEINLNKVAKNFWKVINLDLSNLNSNEKLSQYIKVKAIKNQGIDGYFNPKIMVCDYIGNNCHELSSGVSCKKIYGTQISGAGVSVAVFIDWDGNKTKVGGEISNDLDWEWADGVTDEEKIKFANYPKICACSQKSSCLGDIFATFAKWGDGKNIFYPGKMEKVCDTCSWSEGKQKIKCAPISTAPGPPTFCEQITVSSPLSVKIVPISNEKNDYFDPMVKVIIGDLIGKDGEIGEKLNFPMDYINEKDDVSISSPELFINKHSILDKNGNIHYFETYRKKNELCTEYFGVRKKNESRKILQFPARCFPIPPSPEPKVIEVVNENILKVEMKMGKRNCIQKMNGQHNNGYCIFNTSFNSNENKKIGLSSFRVIKPRIIEKNTKNINKNNFVNLIEDLLMNNSQFKILEKYGLIPNVGIQFPDGDDFSIVNPTENNRIISNKIDLDNIGLPKIKIRYMRVKDQKKSKRKMLCLAGWEPETEEFVLKRDNKVILLKSIGVKYIKYNVVYSKESNQFYYFTNNEIINILDKPQDELDKIMFNKDNYIFFPIENINRNNCIFEKDNEIDEKFVFSKCKIVYKLGDGEYRKNNCINDQESCLCIDNYCTSSTQFLNKYDNKPFYLKYHKIDCKDKNGNILKNEMGEIQKCVQIKDQLIRANRTEVFYADKLCKLDLIGLKSRLHKIIIKKLKDKRQKLEKDSRKYFVFKNNKYEYIDLSQYNSVEIEAWGSGGIGYLNNKNKFDEKNIVGISGDYIKAQIKIDSSYPIIRIKITNKTTELNDKNKILLNNNKNNNNGETLIEMCNLQKKDCKLIITVAGGNKRIYKNNFENYKIETKFYFDDLIEESKIVTGKISAKNNQILYIKDGKVESESVICINDFISNKPGASGCIDKIKGNYSKGSLGYVKIKPIFNRINENKINSVINEMIDNLKHINIDDHFINLLDPNIINTIEEEIKNELLGL